MTEGSGRRACRPQNHGGTLWPLGPDEVQFSRAELWLARPSALEQSA
jgi:hypothetical protein